MSKRALCVCLVVHVLCLVVHVCVWLCMCVFGCACVCLVVHVCVQVQGVDVQARFVCVCLVVHVQASFVIVW